MRVLRCFSVQVIENADEDDTDADGVWKDSTGKDSRH